MPEPPDHRPNSPRPEEVFLRAFFSPPNGAVLSSDGTAWTVLDKAAQPAQADLLAQSSSHAKTRSPAFLPWIQPNVTTWYAVAFEPLQVRVLQQWLRAFIGPTFGAFSEIPIALRSGSKPEQLLRSLSPSTVFSVKAVGPDRKPVGDQVARLLRLLAERPDVALESWDTSSSLLRSFFAALAAGNLHLAAEALSRLKSGAFLDAVNLSFLEIQLLAAREEWSAIASSDRLKDILLLRRPLRIDSLIAAALYRTHLAGKEKEPAALLDAFKAKILPLAGPIFSRQFLGDSSDALRCYLLWRLSSAKDPALIASAATSLSPDDPLRQFAEQHIADLARPVAAPEPCLTIEHARSYSGAGDWQGVIQAVSQLAPSAEVLGLAIRAAAEIGTVAAAQFATAQWSRHGPAHQEAVLRSKWFAGMWKAVSDLCNEQEASFTPPNPAAWFSRLATAPDWPQAQAAWDRGVGEWSFKKFASSSQQVQAVTKVLAAPALEAHGTLRQVLPQLLGQIPEEFRASRSFQKLHLHAAEFLATTEALSEEERELMVEASLRTLDSGLAQLEYSYLVEECFADAWRRASSPRTFPWGLSLLEVVADRPADPGPVRAAFAQLIFADSQRYLPRLSHDQILLLRELLGVCGMQDLAASLPDALLPGPMTLNARQPSSGGIRRLGIYTLMESAAKRARAIIQSAHPNVEVLINADHVATTALQTMARDCDALLVAASCAKHAATCCIQQNLRGRPMIYVNGKGSSSILSGWQSLLESLGG